MLKKLFNKLKFNWKSSCCKGSIDCDVDNTENKNITNYYNEEKKKKSSYEKIRRR